MRSTLLVAALLLALFGASSHACAKTSGGTIHMSASIVPGQTVSVYVSPNGSVQTVVQNNGQTSSSTPALGPPIVAVSFETRPTWYLVKFVTLDKPSHLLTVNF